MPRVLGVIPARFASTRFPGKLLAPLGDKTVLQEVWLRACESARIDRLVIATEDQRIVDAATAFGGEVMLTDPDHPSGTDRVAEVATRLDPEFDLVVNVQGDEPLVTGTSLDRLVDALSNDADASMATLAEAITSADDLFNPNVVKVVVASDGRALYFSRSPIPYHRGTASRLDADFRAELDGRSGGLNGYRKHQGIYAYTRTALAEMTRLTPSPLERDEGLEQLRALEAGWTIRIVDSDFRSQGVDTPADLERVARMLTEAN